MNGRPRRKLYNLTMSKSQGSNDQPPLQHLAIIMDGNGRWAKAKGLPRLKGHQEGANSVLDIAKAAKKFGIPYLSLFAFSTENWSRPASEVNGLFKLLNTFVEKYLVTLHEDQVRLVISGDMNALPTSTQTILKQAIKETEGYTRYTLNICVNYGGQDEVVRASKKVLASIQAGSMKLEDLSPKTFTQFLDAPSLPPIDCLVRTSGEQRLSNFMLYQSAYAELVFVSKPWPAFKAKDLASVIETYQARQRRFGKL